MPDYSRRSLDHGGCRSYEQQNSGKNRTKTWNRALSAAGSESPPGPRHDRGPKLLEAMLLQVAAHKQTSRVPTAERLVTSDSSTRSRHQEEKVGQGQEQQDPCEDVYLSVPQTSDGKDQQDVAGVVDRESSEPQLRPATTHARRVSELASIFRAPAGWVLVDGSGRLVG